MAILRVTPRCTYCGYIAPGLRSGTENKTRSRWRWQLATCQDCREVVSVRTSLPPDVIQSREAAVRREISRVEARLAEHHTVAGSAQLSELRAELAVLREPMHSPICPHCGSGLLALHEFYTRGAFTTWEPPIPCPRCTQYLLTIGQDAALFDMDEDDDHEVN